ncbi:MAG: 50S ribosomal protein L18 [Aureliella sp.]
MKLKKIINGQRLRRKYRVRKAVRGTAERPRLCVQRTLKHMGCQLIDDDAGKTLVSASTRDKSVRDQIKSADNCEAAAAIGKIVAQRAVEAGITQACFDRGSAKYHGRVAALANAAREGGLQF